MSFQKAIRSIIFCLVLIGGHFSAAMAQTQAEDIINGWITDARSHDFVSITHEGITNDAASGVTSVNNLKISINISQAMIEGSESARPDGEIVYTITFPQLRFTRLGLDSGYYSAGRIEADSAGFTLEVNASGNETQGSGSYDGILIENARWARLPAVESDPSRPLSRFYPLVAALTDFSASQMRLGRLKMTQTSHQPSPVRTTAEYGGSIYRNIVRGDTASITMAGVKMMISPLEGTSGEVVNITVGPSSMTDYNAGTLVRSFGPGGWADGAQSRKIIGEMHLGGLDVRATSGTFSIGSIVVRDIFARPTGVDLPATLDALFLLIKNGEEPDAQMIARLVAGSYGSLGLGELSVTGVNFDVPGEAKGSMDRFSIRELSRDGLGGVSVSGVEFAAKDGTRGALGLFDLSGLTFPALDALIGLEAAQARGDIAAIMQAIPTMKKAVMQDVRLTIPGKGDISLASQSVVMGGHIGPIPASLAMSITGLVVPASILEPRERAGLAGLGYDGVNLSLAIRAGWDEVSKIMTLAASGSLADGGKIDATIKLGGIPRSVFENPATAQNILPLITFNQGDAVFDDRSIVDRVLKMLAVQQGVEPDVFRQQVAGSVPFVLQKLNNPDFIRQVTVAVNTLLANRGSISLSARPADPVSVLGLVASAAAAPGAIIELLKLQVSAQ